jgi:alanine racemase
VTDVTMPVSTWAEVDLDRFAANLAAIRDHIGPGREILLVIKADAYGHGAVEMARAAEEEGVAHFGIATLHEGIQLRQAGVRRPIVVLSPLLPSEIADAVTHQLDPTISDLAFGRAFAAAAERAGRPLRFHVEVDTGMGRAGVSDAEADTFVAELCALPGLRLASVYTHFPDADDADLSFAHAQVARFRAAIERMTARGIAPPRIHASNSAGTLNLPEGRFDWVRVGLIAYGHQPPNALTRLALRPAMAFKSRVVQVRDLPAGAPVSYARTFVTSHPTRMGVVAVGYGHGLPWLLSNRGQMLVQGRRVPILGRVTMDLTMVDLSEVPDAAVGDEVVVFGEQGGAALGAEEVAQWSETLPYEILCTIGKRVARIYVRGGRPVKLTSLVGENDEWTQQAADHFRRRALAVAAAERNR